MSVVNARRAERERKILDTAARLFRENGYASTTMRDIAAASELNHATAHYYLQSKAAILYRLYEEAFDGLNVQFADVDGLSADEALTRVIRWAIVELARNPDHIAVFFQELRWLEQNLPEEMSRKLRRREARLTNGVRKIIERGIAEGSLRPVDPRLAVGVIVGNIAWAYQWYQPSLSAESPERTADEYAAVILDGLRL